MPRDPCVTRPRDRLTSASERRIDKADLADDPGKTRCAARRLSDLISAEFVDMNLRAAMDAQAADEFCDASGYDYRHQLAEPIRFSMRDCHLPSLKAADYQ